MQETNRAPLSLDKVRKDLAFAEDTIVFNLFNRSRYARNAVVYEKQWRPISHVTGDGGDVCLLDSTLRETERLDALLVSYREFPDIPFFPDGDWEMESTEWAEMPHFAKTFSVNNQIYDYYINSILPNLTNADNDEAYATSVLIDVQILQLLSRRIHRGTYVAEAKFRELPEMYTAMIVRGDRDGLMEALTDSEVEERVMRRVYNKAARYDDRPELAEYAAALYRDWIIPLTKEVEVQVLLHRFNTQ